MEFQILLGAAYNRTHHSKFKEKAEERVNPLTHGHVDPGEVAQLIPRIQDWLSPRIQESARKKTEAKLTGLK